MPENTKHARRMQRKPRDHQMPPSRTLREWMERGIARTVCGCYVAPDEWCRHGNPSLLIEAGMVSSHNAA